MEEKERRLFNIVQHRNIQRSEREFINNNNKFRKKSQTPTFIFNMATEETKKTTKMCGYLEKRGKLTIMGKWKKWWCVLDGQLLLYYKSRTQYLKLSPCCGSLNVALVKSAQPHTNRQIHMLTHSQLVILRASSKEKQQNWFLAFVNVLQKNKYEALISRQTDHTLKKQIYEQYYCDYCRNNSSEYNDSHVEARRENDFDFDFRARNWEVKLVEKLQFKNRGEKSFTGGFKMNRINSNSINRKDKSTSADGYRSSSHDNLKSTTNTTLMGTDVRIKRFYSVQYVTNFTGDVSPSTEKSSSYHSIVHDNHSNASSLTDGYEFELKQNIARPNSNKEIICNSHEVKRRESLNLLKVFSNRLKQKDFHNKLDCEIQTVAEKKDEQMMVTETLHHLENRRKEQAEIEDETSSTVGENTEETSRDKENPEYSEESMSPTEMAGLTRNSERFSIYLPFRIVDNIQQDESPILPIKQKINTVNYSSKIAELNSGAYDSIGRSFQPEIRHSGTNLDALLQELSLITQDGLTNESCVQNEKEDNEDPDYDFPIPHASLIDNRPENDSSYNFRSENSSYFNITPDSLEVSWINRWSTPDCVFHTSGNQISDVGISLDSLTPHLHL